MDIYLTQHIIYSRPINFPTENLDKSKCLVENISKLVINDEIHISYQITTIMLKKCFCDV